MMEYEVNVIVKRYMHHNMGGGDKLPPVPSPLVKSPPWIIKSLMTLWNLLPLYPSPAGF